jgi:sugar lactone lactonase YvrE
MGFHFLLALQHIPNIDINAKWVQTGCTIVGGTKSGSGANQLSSPYSVYVDHDQTVYVADFANHCIVEWKHGATTGQVVIGKEGTGNRTDQLKNPTDVIIDKESDSLIICDYGNRRVVRWPRRNGINGEVIISNVSCWGLTMDNDGYLYVSDVDKHEVRRWRVGDTGGTMIAGGNGPGNRPDQLDGPYYIIVDDDHSVYVSDSNNQRVMKWMDGTNEGIVVAGNQGIGNSLTQFFGPRGVAVDQLGTVYVADCNNHRVMRWPKGAIKGSIVVGGSRPGEQANQFDGPFGLSLDQEGNLYVADFNNHRVQKFNINPSSNT